MDLSVASSLHGNKITADKDGEITKSLKSEILRDLLCMLVLVTTEQLMTKKAYLQQDGMFMKLSMARTTT